MTEAERRLAAIMFTDMVGYTALTQANESLSLDVLARHQRILRPIFPRFRGREIKTIGDSFLVEFDSALDATNCAVEIQRYLHDYNLSSKEEWNVKLRIGIHLGDVIHKTGDVLGDAVNIASRIEPLAEAGGVCVSEQVFDQVRNKISEPLLKLAPKDLKNVRFSVDVYKVV
ncbi:MAG: adenylate/guanylate cyclase domain-containing protein, partial [Nitrososphaerales archaeon]